MAAAIAMAAVVQTAATSSPPACVDLLASPTAARERRAIVADDLLRMRDFGASDVSTARPSVLAVSPDGRQLAFVLRRADPSTNRYCVALVRVGVAGTEPTILDIGDDVIRSANLNRGLNNGLMGVIAWLTPRWSPDGRWIAMFKNVGGVPQVWRVGIDGAEAGAITKLAEGVDDFAWTDDGTGIVIAHQPGRVTAMAAIGVEGRSGFLYDRRTWSIASSRPSPPAMLPLSIDTVSVATELSRPATPAERHRLETLPNGAPSDAVRATVSANESRLAWVEQYGPAFGAKTRIRVRVHGREIACRWSACGSLNAGLWWDRSGALSWLRTEDDDVKGQMALYRWSPGKRAPRRLLLTDDLIMGCAPLVDEHVVCSREGSTRPRHVIDLDLATGASRTLFDPNPAFASFILGMARRLTWTDRYGIGSFGDLVLPPDHREGQVHPLVVVQYDSRGFLRGGTGDEYPVQLLAAHGFAVLSVNKSATASGLEPQPSLAAYQHVAIPNSTFRRRTLAIVEAGVAAAIATGTIDRTRMGITGLSDGALTACFALMHSDLFKAAILSSGCEEPTADFAYVGPAYFDDLVSWGYPFPDRDPAGFWDDNALSRNRHALAPPLLVETADDELGLALETFAKAREDDRPFELFTFPDEHHIKWQPVHRAAIYQRNLDWFDFWLRGIERTEPETAAQYVRWRAFRASRDAATASSAPRLPRPPTPTGEADAPAHLN